MNHFDAMGSNLLRSGALVMLLPVFWPFFDLFHQKFFARLGRTTVLSPGPIDDARQSS